MHTKGPYTVRDYLRTPAEWRGELVEGELLVTPSPIPYHNYLVATLCHRIREHLGPEQAWRVLPAPTDVFLDDDNVFQPDVLVLPEGDGPTGPEWKIPRPVWVIEVLSPHTAARDRRVKLPVYARSGVEEAWIVFPMKRAVERHELSCGSLDEFAGDATVRSLTLPAFSLELSGFFAS